MKLNLYLEDGRYDTNLLDETLKEALSQSPIFDSAEGGPRGEVRRHRDHHNRREAMPHVIRMPGQQASLSSTQWKLPANLFMRTSVSEV